MKPTSVIGIESPTDGQARHAWSMSPLMLVWGFLSVGHGFAVAGDEVRPNEPTQVRKLGGIAGPFWSFQPLATGAAPQVADDGWARTPIDRFVLAKLEEKGLSPNADAHWRDLVRRTHLDLLGLPPDPQVVSRFLADPSHEALDELVERLLSSPHHGQRWARHWLDVARFAESGGFEHDTDRPHAYHYRDFVIRALNADMPFDQFVRWQIAGDELAGDMWLALTATGFLVAGVFPSQITEVEFEQARYDQLDDMAATTGVAFLGLTVGCARCHDHKYDPISTQDYYRFLANFTTTVPSEVELTAGTAGGRVTAEENPPLALIASEGLTPVKNQSAERGYPYFYPEAHFLHRGDPKQKQGIAQPGFLQVLRRDKGTDDWQIRPPENSRLSFRRASLANWITDAEQGAGYLVARVIVNRLWQHHFGRGIVSTSNDFGRQGARPTHPELLDWLAQRLIDSGWSLKAMHRLILASRVYRQSSHYDPDDAGIDPENQLFWRFHYRRQEAETVRDSMLAVSGLLDQTMFGSGTLDEGMRRRSIYFTVKRSQLIPSMQLLDMPESLVSIGTRSSTTIAPQALMFLNSLQARSCAEGMAGRIVGQGAVAEDEIVRRGYQLTLSREPADHELSEHQQQLATDFEEYQLAKHDDALQVSVANFCQLLMSLNEFVYVE